MKRITTIIGIITVLAISVISWGWGGKSGDSDASGRITKMNVSATNISVSGVTKNGSLWLGYTVRWNDGWEKDYEPIKVRGNFSKSLYFKLRPEGVSEAIVCLWRYKISKDSCSVDGESSDCEHFNKNGFYMEDRIDQRSGY